MEVRTRVIVAIFILCSILLPPAGSTWHHRRGKRHRNFVFNHGFASGGEGGDGNPSHQRFDAFANIFFDAAFGNFAKFRVGFYDQTCPQAEEIVAEVVSEAFQNDKGIAPGILRVHFHDCIVTGCDASLLLDSTPSGKDVEKTSPANGPNLRGIEVIDEIKSRLEIVCPGTVSCSDVLAFAARDSLVLSGVPHYDVPGGRRDSLSSHSEDIDGNMTIPSASIENLAQLFARKGLTVEDMVVLTGAHSIGRAHCPTFAYRVYGFNQTHHRDPKLEPSTSTRISSTCPRPNTPPQPDFTGTSMPFDSSTEFTMDTEFYNQLFEGKGLIESDQAMAEDPRTSDIVKEMASNEDLWLNKFSKAMVQMGKMDVKTGTEGEIRQNCRSVN
ncbi:hypothetical protein F0562_033274 [Nyssa sinensis]|uniref:Peroxidase n=1 Tax=Nyssa sinensis TaxID=561372 RepID=A0A5J5AQA7_9ASTE|nr:hypothetical protein F0562_033274 [Nyssa sinensis]